jgi:DNA-binding protein HU-beta
MNKSELAVKLAKKVGVTQAKSLEIVDAIFNAHKGIIAVELDAGKKVTVPGFGTFSTRQRGAREGRNPATGASIRIPKRHYAAFKPGKTLKEKVAAKK